MLIFSWGYCNEKNVWVSFQSPPLLLIKFNYEQQQGQTLYKTNPPAPTLQYLRETSRKLKIVFIHNLATQKKRGKVKNNSYTPAPFVPDGQLTEKHEIFTAAVA